MQIQYMNMYMKNRSEKKVVDVDVDIVVVDVVVDDDLMVGMMMMRWSCMCGDKRCCVY